MLDNLKVNLQEGTIDNLPEGWTVLFLAKSPVPSAFLFVAIISPEESCLCPDRETPCELDGDVKLVLFSTEHIRVYAAHHGYKYPWGGGMIEVDNCGQRAQWITEDECGRNEILGHRIPPEDVLIAL